MHKHCPVITAVSGFCILAIGTLGSWHFFPAIIDNAIHKNIDLVEGTQSYKFWQKQPFPLKFKIYFFNVTNPEEVQNGGNPIVKEVGPYVYDEYRERVDISLDEDKDLLKYILKKSYFYNKTESGCRDPDDMVTIVNAALVGTAVKVNQMLPSAMSTVSQAVPYLYPGIKDIFLRVKVRDILFEGVRLHCQDPAVEFVCGAMKGALPKTMTIDANGKDVLFSMFGNLNGSSDGPWEMGRGLKNTTRGQIYSYEDEHEMSAWNGEYCNKINGSDSSVFETMPTSDRKQRLYSFAQDFCRSLYVSYDKETEEFGLPSVRYSTKAESLSYTNNPENKCFCPIVTDEDDGKEKFNCPPDGVADIMPCTKAPILVSYPHFYLGDPKLHEYVKGLKPKKELHENFANIEPRTATPLSGRKRIQMNIEIKQIEGFELLENITQGIFPILWIEEGVTLPDDVAQFLVSSLSQANLLNILKWILIVTGILLIVLAAVLMVKQESLLCFAKNDTVDITMPRNGRPIGEVNMGYELNPTLHSQMDNKNVNNFGPKRRETQWNPTTWQN